MDNMRAIKSIKRGKEALEGTGRIEAFSDCVIAIIITILILEIHVPEIPVPTNAGAWRSIIPLMPKIGGFFVSFITVAIFWVNHHHFFHPIAKSDGALLWYNNHLLFWLAVIPFVTAFAGDYTRISLVVALYGFVLCMATLAFLLMVRHVFFRSELLPESISFEERRTQYRRFWLGVGFYAASIIISFIHPYISLAIYLIVPVYYFFPSTIVKTVNTGFNTPDQGTHRK